MSVFTIGRDKRDRSALYLCSLSRINLAPDNIKRQERYMPGCAKTCNRHVPTLVDQTFNAQALTLFSSIQRYTIAPSTSQHAEQPQGPPKSTLGCNQPGNTSISPHTRVVDYRWRHQSATNQKFTGPQRITAPEEKRHHGTPQTCDRPTLSRLRHSDMGTIHARWRDSIPSLAR